MVRIASRSKDAPLKSTSSRTELRGWIVTKSGTFRAISSTSLAEQFEQSTKRIRLPSSLMNRRRSVMYETPDDKAHAPAHPRLKGNGGTEGSFLIRSRYYESRTLIARAGQLLDHPAGDGCRTVCWTQPSRSPLRGVENRCPRTVGDWNRLQKAARPTLKDLLLAPEARLRI